MSTLEPSWVIAGPPPANILSGTIDAVLVDAGNNPTEILDRTLANGINVTWELTGIFASAYLGDSFSLVAYLDSQIPGGTDYQFPPAPVPTFLGSTGTASGTPGTGGYELIFDPPAAPAVSISIPASTVDAGVYRMTVVLTHTPAGGNPRVAGFLEKTVQFF
jgi:hypothetical protein